MSASAADTDDERSTASRARPSVTRDPDEEDDVTIIMTTHLSMDKEEIGNSLILRAILNFSPRGNFHPFFYSHG
jgi:hypothetical protein